jgi:hypothetical protein
MSADTLIKKIEALPDNVSLEIWTENADTGEGKEYAGELCDPSNIADLKRLAADLQAAIEGLEHYADKSNWNILLGYPAMKNRHKLGYEVAEQTLAAIRKGTKKQEFLGDKHSG